MEDVIPLATLDFSTWSELPTEEDIGKAIAQLAILDHSTSTCVALVRPVNSETAFGAVISVEISQKDGSLTPKAGVFNIKPTGAFAVHPSEPIIAVGLLDGCCKLTCLIHASPMFPSPM